MDKNNEDLEASGSSNTSDESDSGECSTITPIKVLTRAKTKTENTQTDTTKKKKKKKSVSICLTNCRYSIIRKVAQKFGLKEVSESDNWNLYWTDLSISIERCKEMKRFQRINHFPGMLEICRKDLLARNLNRMAKAYPKEYNFFPKSWCLPADLGDALHYNRTHRHKFFILKPDAGSQGRGIFITRSLKDLKPTERLICQVYVQRPLLIDGYKFDLRVYTLITSCDPLRVYVYDEGLVRFATSRYQQPNGINHTNVFMHLTNYAVNKHSRTYSIDGEAPSKRKLSWFKNFMRSQGMDVKHLWQRIDDIIIKTVFSALPILRHSYNACFPNHDLLPACCELLGMDILVDEDMKLWLLEVNHSPSFHTDSVLDEEVKDKLLTDMFQMLNLAQCDKRKVIKDERRRIQERLIRGHPKDGDSATPSSNVRERESFIEYHKHEVLHRGGYRLVYPESRTEHQYVKFLRQKQGSLYSDTACSSARQVAALALRDEIQVKQNTENDKRMKSLTKQKTPPDAKSLRSIPNVPVTIERSFQPQTIVEAEEKDRLSGMAQRDFLVKSVGLMDHVYNILKQQGVLRTMDERKYNQLKMATMNNKQATDDGDKKPNIQNMLDFGPLHKNPIKCHTARMHIRPEAPATWSGMTKKHIARSLSNSVKIHSNMNREERNTQKKSVVS